MARVKTSMQRDEEGDVKAHLALNRKLFNLVGG